MEEDGWNKSRRKIGRLTLFYDNFVEQFKPNTCKSPYKYFFSPEYGLANDASGGVMTNCEGLTINSVPFTKTSPDPIDNIKFLALTKNNFNAPQTGEIVCETILSARQTGLHLLPEAFKNMSGMTGVNNENSDNRLANGFFGMGDNIMMFGVALTNEDIYLLYSKPPWSNQDSCITLPDFSDILCSNDDVLTTLSPCSNPLRFSDIEYDNVTSSSIVATDCHIDDDIKFSPFLHIIPWGKRDADHPHCDYIKVSIAYNYECNYVRWSINDVEIYRLNRIGFPLERNTRQVDYGAHNVHSKYHLYRMKSVSPMFGTMSIMNGYNPQNPGLIANVGLVNLANSIPQSDPIITNVSGTNFPATFLTDYNTLGMIGTNFGQGVILNLKYLAVYLIAKEKKINIFPDLFCCKEKILFSRCDQDFINGVNASEDTIFYRCKGHIKDCTKYDICDNHKCKKYNPTQYHLQ